MDFQMFVVSEFGFTWAFRKTMFGHVSRQTVLLAKNKDNVTIVFFAKNRYMTDIQKMQNN